jgi:CBS domain-containing protein
MEKTVEQYMSPHPIVVDAERAVADCAKLMDTHEIGAVGVTREGLLFGVLTDRDIVVRTVARDRDPRSVTAGDIASKHLITVDRGASLEDAAREMSVRGVRRLFVVDADGRPTGILTADDLAALRDPDSVAAHAIRDWGLSSYS